MYTRRTFSGCSRFTPKGLSTGVHIEDLLPLILVYIERTSGAATGHSGGATGIPRNNLQPFYWCRHIHVHCLFLVYTERTYSRRYWCTQKGHTVVANGVQRERGDFQLQLLVYTERTFSGYYWFSGCPLFIQIGPSGPSTGVHGEELQWLLLMYTERNCSRCYWCIQKGSTVVATDVHLKKL